MNEGKYILREICDLVGKKELDWLVKKYEGKKCVKKLSCWNDLVVMILGELRDGGESVGELIGRVNGDKSKLKRVGFGRCVRRSNVWKGNEEREGKIFEEMVYDMVKRGRELGIGLVEKELLYEGNVYGFE